MPGEGNRGSTSGLRFNPREAPEFTEEDRTYAMGDAREREKEDSKKVKERDDRRKKLSGLRHLKVKVEQRPQSEDFDSQEQVGEQASMTGPPGMSQAFSPGGGLGGGGASLQMSEPMDVAFQLLKWGKSGARKTATLESTQRSERAKRGAKTRKEKGPTTESIRTQRRKAGGPLSVFGRDPRVLPTTRMGALKTVGETAGVPQTWITGKRFRGVGERPSIAQSPHQRIPQVERSRVSRLHPTQEAYTPPLPYQTGRDRPPLAGQRKRKRNPALGGPPSVKRPRVPDTPMGAKTSAATALAAGPLSAKTPHLTKGKIGGALTTMAASALGGLMARPKRMFSQGDVADIRMLLQRLKRIVKSDGFQKSFYNGKGDGEKPSPNAHPRQTSAPTGATEADPDDDATLWGAHPIGLLAPRRGHQ